MDNITEEICFQSEMDNFEHPVIVKIMLSILNVLIMVSVIVMSHKLFKVVEGLGPIYRVSHKYLDNFLKMGVASK